MTTAPQTTAFNEARPTWPGEAQARNRWPQKGKNISPTRTPKWGSRRKASARRQPRQPVDYSVTSASANRLDAVATLRVRAAGLRNLRLPLTLMTAETHNAVTPGN